MAEKLICKSQEVHPGRWYAISFLLHLVVGLLIVHNGAKIRYRPPVIIDLTLDTVARLAPTLESPASTPRQAQPLVPVKLAAPQPRQTGTDLRPSMPMVAAPVLVPVTTFPQPGERHTLPEQVPVPRFAAAPAAATGGGGSSAGVVERTTAGPAGGATGETDREKTRQRYLKEHFTYIRDLVTKRLVYPLQARRMGWGGKVTVSFVVSEDGSARNIAVRESSGHQLLDNCAMDTIRMVAPFPKPPAPAEITIPVQFRLR